mmetsp:Transcript_4092/g.18556  ORF Transcript_4092/g.18556 Transcript_4092/m.18556 type:complete len:244 (-) Transcript_4092:917-1648(-)
MMSDPSPPLGNKIAPVASQTPPTIELRQSSTADPVCPLFGKPRRLLAAEGGEGGGVRGVNLGAAASAGGAVAATAAAALAATASAAFAPVAASAASTASSGAGACGAVLGGGGGRGLEAELDLGSLLGRLALALALRLGSRPVEGELVDVLVLGGEGHGGEGGGVNLLGLGALGHGGVDGSLLGSLGSLEVLDGDLVVGLLGLGLGFGFVALLGGVELVAGLAPAALAGAAAVGALVAVESKR